MNNSIYRFPNPGNEPVKTYAPGTSDKAALKKALLQLSAEEWDIPLVIGGQEIRTGQTDKVVMPHDHRHVLATYHKAGEKEVQMAIDAAMKAHHDWSMLPWEERAMVMLRAAELFATKYRYLLNAAVMLGQSKNPFQAEIDAPCELIDLQRLPRRADLCRPTLFGEGYHQPLGVSRSGGLRLLADAVQLHLHRLEPQHGTGYDG